jgi:hypothetical protein
MAAVWRRLGGPALPTRTIIGQGAGLALRSTILAEGRCEKEMMSEGLGDEPGPELQHAPDTLEKVVRERPDSLWSASGLSRQAVRAR